MGARNVPIMCCMVTTIVSQQGGQLMLVVDRVYCKGWIAGWRRPVIGESLDWASDQGSLNGICMRMQSRLCNKAKDVCGESSAPLQSVINCVMILPIPGRNCERSVERNSMKF